MPLDTEEVNATRYRRS